MWKRKSKGEWKRGDEKEYQERKRVMRETNRDDEKEGERGKSVKKKIKKETNK